MAYQIEIRHDELHKYRVISGADEYIVNQKAEAQLQAWDEMWQKKLEAEKIKKEKQLDKQKKEEKKLLAAKKTREAQDNLNKIENVLRASLKIDSKLDWNKLKDFSDYSVKFPEKPKKIQIPQEPKNTDNNYQYKFNIIDFCIRSRKKKKIDELKMMFEKDHKEWEKEKEGIKDKNNRIEKEYEEKLANRQKDKELFKSDQEKRNKELDSIKEKYLEKDGDAIVFYCMKVLEGSEYPIDYDKKIDIEYNSENKILIVDFSLPSLDDIPTLIEVKYIQTNDEFKEYYLAETKKNKIYDALLYQMTLRSIYELFNADITESVDSIVLNGWVDTIDKGTGKDIHVCILSIQSGRDEFISINLNQVEPKVCFKNLKGVGSSKLHGLAPIAPIIQIEREDSRFVSSYAVADSIDESENIASMDWEDFEHLVRELFEKEFSQAGGEVNVTQASRDGGVDAVAFDPDPIRGGKIVIQAKRYTNVVGVSAVRDLYGTVVNEGATKGILITTSEYGPDAYKFAKGKPLTLLSGSNLLHLLEKHGYKAKIDLKEAKKILSEREKES